MCPMLTDSTKTAVGNAARSSASWIARRPLVAVLIAVLLGIALGGGGTGIVKDRAIAGYQTMIRGWQAAYHRDTSASEKKYEAKIKALTDDRDAYRRKWEEARARMDAPWRKPSGATELEERFRALGFTGRVK